VHNGKVNLLCPVYGCNRVAKPFPRLDKFREHFGKHKDASKFLCFIEKCRIGPLTRAELRGHLVDRHLHDYFHETYLREYFATLGFLGTCPRIKSQHLGFSLFDFAQKRKEGKTTCPLRKLGGDFQLSFDYPYMGPHLSEHSIKECFKAHGEIAAIYPIPDIFDTLRCPLCHMMILRSWPVHLVHHLLLHHSKEERLVATSIDSERSLEPSRPSLQEILSIEKVLDVIMSLDLGKEGRFRPGYKRDLRARFWWPCL
jgi:hypothetical protein